MKKLSKITESVWSDMQERGTGDLEKKEDNVDLLDIDGLYNYIKSKYEKRVIYLDKDWYYDIYVDILSNVSLIAKPISNNSKSKLRHILLSWSRVRIRMSLFDKLSELFNVENINTNRRIITEKDGTCTNKTFIKLIDFFLENIDNILINESVWSDMQDRGTGDLEKKEDTIGNSNVLKPVDLGGSVYWADKDLVVDNQELFTFYDAVDIIRNVRGWRLPTKKEASELYGHNMYYDQNYVYLDDDRKISFKKAGVGYLNQNNMPYTLDEGRSFYGWTSDQFQADSMHVFIIDNDEIDVSCNASQYTVICQSKDSRCSIKLVRDK